MINYDFLEKQIDWKNLLIANYKQLGLSEEEVIVILVVQYCIDQNEKAITPDIISLLTNYDSIKSSNILTNLLNKGLIMLENDENGNLITTLKGIKRILIEDFVKDNNDNNSYNTSLFSKFESEFGRTLSFVEIEMLKSWIDNNVSEEIIKYALSVAVSKNIKNMRYIERIIISLKQEEERKKEGWTTVGSKKEDVVDSFSNLDNDNK